MKQFSKIFTLMCLCAMFAVPRADAQHLLITSVNDTHSQIDPASDGKGGMARIRAIYDKLRDENENTAFIHAGDAVQGTLYFSLYKGDVEYALLDSLGYDAIIMGNHELDNGVESLLQHYSNVKAHKLTANYDMSGTPLADLFQPYWIKAVGDKHVAFFGINVNPAGLISQANCTGMRYLDPRDVADATAKYLKEVQKADYAIMVSHIGYDSYEPGGASDTSIIANSHYIDLVIGGHSHTVIKPGSDMARHANADGRLIPVGQAGNAGKQIATYDLDLATGDINYGYINVDAAWDEAASRYTAMNEWIAEYRVGVDSIMNAPAGISKRAMKKSGAALQNWVSDASLDIVKKLSGIKNIDCAIMNKGGIRVDMPQGAVSEGVLGSMFPFDNRYVVLEMPGSALLDCIKAMAGRKGDAVSKDLRVTFNANGEVTSAKLKGKNISPDKTYIVATIDYLANGGDYMDAMMPCKRLYVDGEKYGMHLLNYVKELQAAGKLIEATDEVRMQLK